MEEDVIRRAQHLHLIYSQLVTLYDIIPYAPRPSNDKTRTAPGPHANGVIGSVSASTVSQVAGQLVQLAITDNPASTTLEMTSNTPTQSTNVNLVQTSKNNRWKNHNQRRKNTSGEQGEPNVK